MVVDRDRWIEGGTPVDGERGYRRYSVGSDLFKPVLSFLGVSNLFMYKPTQTDESQATPESRREINHWCSKMKTKKKSLG